LLGQLAARQDGNLLANPQRFPHGMKALADYIHQRGLKFGLYSSAGSWTCEPKLENRGFPGGLGHEKQDAASFASFGVDYLKYDNLQQRESGCQACAIARWARHCVQRGRPIFYSLCEWGQNQAWHWAGDAAIAATPAHDGRHQGHL